MSLGTRRQALSGLAVLALVAVAGCEGPKTSVTQVWSAQLGPPQVKSMIVFATRMDQASRRSLEDALVTVIAKHGVTAKQSYLYFPDDPPEKEEARKIVQAAGFDGILVTSLQRVREKQVYIPGAYQTGFWAGYYDRGWGTWSPGYVMTEESVVFDTTLWDTRAGDKLAWAMLTETTNPSQGPKFVKSVSNAVEVGLERAAIIPKLPE